MPIEDRIAVYIMPEEAGGIALRPAVMQWMLKAELLDLLVSQVGKAPQRLQQLLREGGLVVGGSRFRWEPQLATLSEIEQLIAHYPDPDPGRKFDFAWCVRVVFHTRSGRSIEVSREVGLRRRWLQRWSFWERLGEVVAGLTPLYVDYSYAERADRYRIRLSRETARQVQELCRLLAFDVLARRLEREELVGADVYLAREPA